MSQSATFGNLNDFLWIPCHSPLLSIHPTEIHMPKLTIQDIGTFDVPVGKRLTKALVDDAHTDQLHACGGKSKCTTCRVQFIDGEPDQITAAEAETLKIREVTDPGVRLSRQITCDHDMTIELISRLEGSGRSDQGSPLADPIEPEPQWQPK